MTVFTKLSDFPDFPKNSDFAPFFRQNSRSGNILDACKFNDIASIYHLPQNQGFISFSFKDMTNFGSS